MKIGIDIGGTSIRVGLIKNNNVIRIIAFENDVKNYDKMIEKIFLTIEELVKNDKLDFIGIASPGYLDVEKGIILQAWNLDTWVNKNLKEVFYNKFKVDVGLNNDANVAALGQYVLKTKKAGIKSILYFTISTGIGGGYVENGRIFSGSTGKSLEVSNAIPDLESGDVFKSGIEYIASGKNILNNLKKLGIKAESTKEIFDYYYKGDNEIVNDYFSKMKKKLIEFFTTAVYFFDTKIIVLGGSVALKNQDFFKELFKKVQEILYNTGFNVNLEFAEDIDNATLLGCANL